MKRKICITTGTRSEYGLLRPLLKEIKQSKNFELFVIVAGMHLSEKFGNSISEIKNDGFKVNFKIKMIPNGNSGYHMAKALGDGIKQFSNVFKKINPDINLILGDRDEALASALAAYHMNIINAHIHGGDKTRAGLDEYTRHAITKISNIHFAVSKKSKSRIIKLGENPKYVFLTGSPSIDEIKANKITSKVTLQKKFGLSLNGDEIILLQHPVTTQTKLSHFQILETMKAISLLKKPTISIFPNSDAGHEDIFKIQKQFSKKYSFIKNYRNIPRSDFLGLLKHCGVLVGNSSSGIIEGSYFNIPVVNIGSRQENREGGKNIINVTVHNHSLIYDSIVKALNTKQKKFKNHFIYGHGNASKKITKILSTIKLDENLLEKQINY